MLNRWLKKLATLLSSRCPKCGHSLTLNAANCDECQSYWRMTQV